MKNKIQQAAIILSFILASIGAIFLYAEPIPCSTYEEMCKNNCAGVDYREGFRVYCFFSQSPCPVPDWVSEKCI